MEIPVTIGLTGGIASGKSTVATMFSRLGASVLDADRFGHEVLNEEDVKKQIIVTWGNGVFDNGEVDRKALAKIVFDPVAGQKQLTKLEEITHPKIKARILTEIQAAKIGNVIAVVLDAPLLFEAGWDEICDELVFVKTTRELRLARVKKRGWSEDELLKREQRQMDVFQKRSVLQVLFVILAIKNRHFHKLNNFGFLGAISPRRTKARLKNT